MRIYELQGGDVISPREGEYIIVQNTGDYLVDTNDNTIFNTKTQSIEWSGVKLYREDLTPLNIDARKYLTIRGEKNE